jgi:hypothetical protein
VWVVLFAQFDLPAGQGKLAVKVKVMASDTYTNSLLYTYKSPIVVAVSPSDIPAAGGALLVISGQDLGVDLTAAGRVLGGAANATWRSNSVSIGTSGDCEVVEVGYIASDVPVWQVGGEGERGVRHSLDILETISLAFSSDIMY